MVIRVVLKVNAAKTNYKNVVKWVKTELVKCNAGLSDKMFTSNPQSCPISHANNFANGMIFVQCMYANRTNFLMYLLNSIYVKNPYKKLLKTCVV